MIYIIIVTYKITSILIYNVKRNSETTIRQTSNNSRHQVKHTEVVNEMGVGCTVVANIPHFGGVSKHISFSSEPSPTHKVIAILAKAEPISKGEYTLILAVFYISAKR